MLATMSPGRRLLVLTGATLAALAVLIAGSAAVIRLSGPSGDASAHAGNPPATAAPSSPVPAPGGGASPLSAAQSADVARDVAALTAQPTVPAAESARYRAIPETDRGQPDLYARAFVSELLSQDYRRPRAELLSWVQAESALSNEPTVIGLVPAALRPKLAVYSLTSSPDGSPIPVPSASEWTAWGRVGGYSTVTVQNVMEPPTWSQAVAAGKLTDPGVTARDVDAQVTTHWMQAGKARSAIRSVSISLTLEGPRSRSGFGFVCAVTFRSVAVS